MPCDSSHIRRHILRQDSITSDSSWQNPFESYSLGECWTKATCLHLQRVHLCMSAIWSGISSTSFYIPQSLAVHCSSQPLQATANYYGSVKLGDQSPDWISGVWP